MEIVANDTCPNCRYLYTSDNVLVSCVVARTFGVLVSRAYSAAPNAQPLYKTFGSPSPASAMHGSTGIDELRDKAVTSLSFFFNS